MIKIEKINAVGATVVRGGIRQPLLTNSNLTTEELASIQADSGTVVYSVDEQEIKEINFTRVEPTPPATPTAAVVTKPVIKQPPPRVSKPAKS